MILVSVITACAAKLTSTAIGLPAASSKRITASIGSVGFGVCLVWRLRLRSTSSRGNSQPAGHGVPVGRQDRLDDQVREFFAVGDRLVEFAFAETGTIGEFDDRAVMRVAATDSTWSILAFSGDRATDFFHHRRWSGHGRDRNRRARACRRRPGSPRPWPTTDQARRRKGRRAGRHSPTSASREAA